MPIHRAFRDDVLVLTYVGDFTTQDSIDAVEEAIADPAFRRGMAICSMAAWRWECSRR